MLPRFPSRGRTGTLKIGMIYFGFKSVFFSCSDFAPKNKTLKKLPTHCIVHYPCPQMEWHFRLGAAIKHAEDFTVNSWNYKSGTTASYSQVPRHTCVWENAWLVSESENG